MASFRRLRKTVAVSCCVSLILATPGVESLFAQSAVPPPPPGGTEYPIMVNGQMRMFRTPGPSRTVDGDDIRQEFRRMGASQESRDKLDRLLQVYPGCAQDSRRCSADFLDAADQLIRDRASTVNKQAEIIDKFLDAMSVSAQEGTPVVAGRPGVAIGNIRGVVASMNISQDSKDKVNALLDGMPACEKDPRRCPTAFLDAGADMVRGNFYGGEAQDSLVTEFLAKAGPAATEASQRRDIRTLKFDNGHTRMWETSNLTDNGPPGQIWEVDVNNRVRYRTIYEPTRAGKLELDDLAFIYTSRDGRETEKTVWSAAPANSVERLTRALQHKDDVPEISDERMPDWLAGIRKIDALNPHYYQDPNNRDLNPQAVAEAVEAVSALRRHMDDPILKLTEAEKEDLALWDDMLHERGDRYMGQLRARNPEDKARIQVGMMTQSPAIKAILRKIRTRSENDPRKTNDERLRAEQKIQDDKAAYEAPCEGQGGGGSCLKAQADALKSLKALRKLATPQEIERAAARYEDAKYKVDNFALKRELEDARKQYSSARVYVLSSAEGLNYDPFQKIQKEKGKGAGSDPSLKDADQILDDIKNGRVEGFKPIDPDGALPKDVKKIGDDVERHLNYAEQARKDAGKAQGKGLAKQRDAFLEKANTFLQMAGVQEEAFDHAAQAQNLGQYRTGKNPQNFRFLKEDQPAADAFIKDARTKFRDRFRTLAKRTEDGGLGQAVLDFASILNAARYEHTDPLFLKDGVAALLAHVQHMRVVYLSRIFPGYLRDHPDFAKKYWAMKISNRTSGTFYEEDFLPAVQGTRNVRVFDDVLADLERASGATGDPIATRQRLAPVEARQAEMFKILGYSDVPARRDLQKEQEATALFQSALFRELSEFDGRMRMFTLVNLLNLNMLKSASSDYIPEVLPTAGWGRFVEIPGRWVDSKLNWGGYLDKSGEKFASWFQREGYEAFVGYKDENGVWHDQKDRRARIREDLRDGPEGYERAIQEIALIDRQSADRARTDYRASLWRDIEDKGRDLFTALTKPPDSEALARAQGSLIGAQSLASGYVKSFMVGNALAFIPVSLVAEIVAGTAAAAVLRVIAKGSLRGIRWIGRARDARALAEMTRWERTMRTLARMAEFTRLPAKVLRFTLKYSRGLRHSLTSRFGFTSYRAWGNAFWRTNARLSWDALKFTFANTVMVSLSSSALELWNYWRHPTTSNFHSGWEVLGMGLLGGATFGIKSGWMFTLVYPASAVAGKNVFSWMYKFFSKSVGPATASVELILKFIRWASRPAAIGRPVRAVAAAGRLVAAPVYPVFSLAWRAVGPPLLRLAERVAENEHGFYGVMSEAVQNARLPAAHVAGRVGLFFYRHIEGMAKFSTAAGLVVWGTRTYYYHMGRLWEKVNPHASARKPDDGKNTEAAAASGTDMGIIKWIALRSLGAAFGVRPLGEATAAGPGNGGAAAAAIPAGLQGLAMWMPIGAMTRAAGLLLTLPAVIIASAHAASEGVASLARWSWGKAKAAGLGILKWISGADGPLEDPETDKWAFSKDFQLQVRAYQASQSAKEATFLLIAAGGQGASPENRAKAQWDEAARLALNERQGQEAWDFLRAPSGGTEKQRVRISWYHLPLTALAKYAWRRATEGPQYVDLQVAREAQARLARQVLRGRGTSWLELLAMETLQRYDTVREPDGSMVIREDDRGDPITNHQKPWTSEEIVGKANGTTDQPAPHDVDDPDTLLYPTEESGQIAGKIADAIIKSDPEIAQEILEADPAKGLTDLNGRRITDPEAIRRIQDRVAWILFGPNAKTIQRSIMAEIMRAAIKAGRFDVPELIKIFDAAWNAWVRSVDQRGLAGRNLALAMGRIQDVVRYGVLLDCINEYALREQEAMSGMWYRLTTGSQARRDRVEQVIQDCLAAINDVLRTNVVMDETNNRRIESLRDDGQAQLIEAFYRDLLTRDPDEAIRQFLFLFASGGKTPAMAFAVIRAAVLRAEWTRRPTLGPWEAFRRGVRMLFDREGGVWLTTPNKTTLRQLQEEVKALGRGNLPPVKMTVNQDLLFAEVRAEATGAPSPFETTKVVMRDEGDLPDQETSASEAMPGGHLTEGHPYLEPMIGMSNVMTNNGGRAPEGHEWVDRMEALAPAARDEEFWRLAETTAREVRIARMRLFQRGSISFKPIRNPQRAKEQVREAKNFDRRIQERFGRFTMDRRPGESLWSALKRYWRDKVVRQGIFGWLFDDGLETFLHKQIRTGYELLLKVDPTESAKIYGDNVHPLHNGRDSPTLNTEERFVLQLGVLAERARERAAGPIGANAVPEPRRVDLPTETNVHITNSELDNRAADAGVDIIDISGTASRQGIDSRRRRLGTKPINEEYKTQPAEQEYEVLSESNSLVRLNRQGQRGYSHVSGELKSITFSLPPGLSRRAARHYQELEQSLRALILVAQRYTGRRGVNVGSRGHFIRIGVRSPQEANVMIWLLTRNRISNVGIVHLPADFTHEADAEHMLQQTLKMTNLNGFYKGKVEIMVSDGRVVGRAMNWNWRRFTGPIYVLRPNAHRQAVNDVIQDNARTGPGRIKDQYRVHYVNIASASELLSDTGRGGYVPEAIHVMRLASDSLSHVDPRDPELGAAVSAMRHILPDSLRIPLSAGDDSALLRNPEFREFATQPETYAIMNSLLQDNVQLQSMRPSGVVLPDQLRPLHVPIAAPPPPGVSPRP